MSTCRWCTPGGPVTTELLTSYAARDLPSDDLSRANDDLSYCMECVVEYHRVRDEAPQLHKALWKMETSRLIVHLEKSMREEIEEDDELFLVEEDGEKQLFGFTGPNFESNVRVPLLEILKYPYLLLNKRVSELCGEALCKMEQVNNPFQLYEKLAGVYLLLVHPNENIRRWAILTARTQGKVDRDDYYELQEVFTCLFKVIELGLFENPEIYGYSELEDGKLILLPSHLYDTTNYKNYWLGICMLLTVLEEQAMDSLLLGPDKQNDFMQSILHVMEKQTEDESTNPFWPALQCFMLILDRLGSKVWGQLIDPIQAFQTIIASPSYNSEIETLRESCKRPTKCEPDSDDEDFVSCSQIVYNFNTDKVKKDTGRKTAISHDYCPNMYEDMQSLTNILQSDIGQDMRVHNSTFLWFVPYVQSVMDLKDLGVAYIMEVIHHLCFEIKDVLNQRNNQVDKVTELFIRVFVSIIELHRSKKCIHLLWVSSHKWVDALVKCSLIPTKDVVCRSNSKIVSTSALSSSPNSQTPSSVQIACIQLIRNLLREGYQLGQQATCKPYLDKLNLIIRGNVLWNLELSKTEIQGLQTCLTQIIKSIKDKSAAIPNSPQEQATTSKAQSVPFIKTERIDDDDDYWYGPSSNSPLPSPDIKFLSERGWEDVFPVKREPPDGRNSEAELCCTPSSVLKTSDKKAQLPETDSLDSAPKAMCSSIQENVNPEKERKRVMSGLSKLVAKSSNVRVKRESSISENKVSSSESNSTVKTLNQSGVHLKRQQDLGLKAKPISNEFDTDEDEDSDEEISLMEIKKNLKEKSKQSLPDKLEVSRELERLSLENKPETKHRKRELQDMREAGPSHVQNDCVMHSETDEDDLPLTQVRKILLQKTSKKSALTDSPVDRDLDRLSAAAEAKSFLEDSNQDVMSSQEFCAIQRKVKGTTRSVVSDDSSSETELSSDQIITISDDSSDDEQKAIPKSIKLEKPETFQDTTTSASTIIPKKEIKSEPYFANEYDSQCFEFETQDDIYSAWGDSQLEEQKPMLQENKSSNPETSDIQATDFDFDNNFEQWGYDTDYICDETIEKAAEDAERQFKQSTSAASAQPGAEGCSSKPSHKGISPKPFYGKSSRESVTKDIKLDSKGKPSNIPKETSSLSSKMNTTRKLDAPGSQKKTLNAKTNKNKSPFKKVSQVRKLGSPGKMLPAVVPPKKSRKFPEATSTVEKLGLKKAPRKAFELSQRTLDSVENLRNHGKSAGFVEAKRQRTKLTSPKSLLVNRNKKMLACQDIQFYRQSRPKETEKRRLSNNSDSGGRNFETSAKPKGNKTEDVASIQKKQGRTEGNEDRSRKTEDHSHRSLKATKISSHTSMNSASEVPKEDCSNGLPWANVVQQSTSIQEDNVQTSTVAESKDCDDDDDDDDGLFLTQTDPLDMELCSQVESEISVGILEESSTSSMVDSSALVPKVSEMSKCKYNGCSEPVTVPGDHCPKHTVPDKADDHLFARPGLPPSLQKPTKPSTAKVFSSGTTSRTASLTKDLENLPKYPMVPKAKAQLAKPSISRAPIPPPGQSKAPVSYNTSNVLQPLINQNNVPLHPTSTNAGTFPVAGSCYPQREQAWLTREVLRWTYEMFDNKSQFGTPNNLCQLPLMKVPLKISGFDEYFNVFVPLMLLNTFESLAQEWAVKQRVLHTYLYKLYLQNFCVDSQLNRAEFQVWIRDADLNFQRHPKEDDLVFLLTPESPSNLPREEKVSPVPNVYHTGYVFRFTRSQRTEILEKEQYTMCDLCIHTYGNLSAYRNQQVQCAVIGSLITTQRQFKALLQMQRNPLFRPIIYPKPTDFLPRDTENEPSLFPSLKDYNNDQRFAIEKAHAMVKQHPRLPKICLIHGPPGTGKSRTIVGLLYRILMEKRSSDVPDQNFNAKNKRNRVLVCAPSNAALDELMKKIILEFKEKCYNKNNTLGNCGDINLVRLGAEKTISPDVVKFSLDHQVNYKINRAQQDHGIHSRKEALDRQLDELSRQRALERCNKQTCEELDQKIAQLSKERQLMANSLKELRRRPQEVQRSVILESHVICCTLSTSGGFLLESAFRQLGQEPFSCVIVDEAGQSCEVETLIPLLHRCSKLVLVGDPEQLPPTVISMKAEELGYGQSLMSRLCQNLEVTGSISPVLQLTVQYRMHPDICLFPSNYFYKRALKTDRQTEEDRFSSVWPFQPYIVFDVADGFEKKERESFSNPQEIKMVVALIKLIKSKKIKNIGIITPYRAQKMLIIDELRKLFGNETRSSEVDTVDGFQGRQKDCIIVTCVRANCIQGCIGFLASRQRLNVTITRAKFSLFILGSLRTLCENKDWNHLIQDAQKRGAIIKTKEDHYQRDVNRILKLPRTHFNPPSQPVVRPIDHFSHTRQTVAHTRELNNIPRPAAIPAPPRIVAHPAVDIRNQPSSSTQIARGKLQDPRLARRQEATRDASAPTFGLPQPSATNHSQSRPHQHLHSSPVAGVRPPSQQSSRDPWSRSAQGEGHLYSRDQDYRERRASYESNHEAKKRKVSQ